jgi:YD repeat-containing protein
VDYKSKDFDIDASTGLPIFSRDGNGRVTGLDYDLLGRLRVTRPPAEAETVYDYFMTERPVRVTARQKLASSATSETETHYYYDGVGRLIQEKRRMPSGWATISTSYDLNGRKSSVTVPTFTSTSAYRAVADSQHNVSL